MPLQNRVTPFGEILALAERGLFMGNRGIIHDPQRRQLLRRRWTTKAWIICLCEFRGVRRQVMSRRSWTELFFLDEATALAAGHRPCALCRRDDYARFCAIWSELHPGESGADAIDAQLHRERVDPVTRRRHLHEAPFLELPDGTFVLEGDAPFLVLGTELLRWTPSGYGELLARPRHGRAVVISPPSLVAVLSFGWQGQVPLLHPSAR